MSHGAPNNPYGQQPPQPNPYGQQAPQGVPPQGYGYPQQPGQSYPSYPQQSGMPGPGMPPGVPPLATMGRRLGARLIDGALFFVVYLVFLVPKFSDFLDAVQACDANSSAFDTCVNNATSDFQSSTLPIAGIFMLLVLLYEVLLTAFVGATLGKMAVGIRVLKAETGAKPGIGGGFLRWIIPTVGSFACGIGALLVYLSPFWDKSGRRQGWHDKVASTVVVYVKG
ncbi:RDD family protein [Streptomyces kunmingensis]|uniref:RDD family protein n=1 Tax=Streptomyces kunmingensis TaxID=68225 RepID=A0ABU6CP45_9ACTN|nr:RDD family protein [Streptomyces kunmingensis]MEB3966457.1 RDD family protein [Streptomyces kunmingensis]